MRRQRLIIASILWFLIGAVTLTLLNINGDVYADTVIELIGKNILVVVFLTLLWFYMLHFKSSVLLETKQMFLFAMIYMLVMVPAILLIETNYIYVIPFIMLGMIVALMMDEILGIMANIVIVLILAVIGDLSVSFILFFIISGSIAPILSLSARERQNMLYVSLYLMALHGVLTIITSLLVTDGVMEVPMDILAFSLIHGAIAVIMTYGSLPLWETMFGVVTPFRLLELTGSNQKLLQRLMIDAPGTYHHSQMVANLAEKAAADIGVNALLARTGALYHDIGKMKTPEYFIENQNGENPHDGIAPDSSASMIINHVALGEKYGKEYKLPQVIIDIIKQHHGDSTVQFFYKKALDHSDGYEIDINDFKYPGPKPLTDEAAIVMIADATEAAIRAKNTKDMDDIKEVIRQIIQSRVSDGQLSACDLKLKDLVRIEKAFIKVYNGMYHERVTY